MITDTNKPDPFEQWWANNGQLHSSAKAAAQAAWIASTVHGLHLLGLPINRVVHLHTLGFPTI